MTITLFKKEEHFDYLVSWMEIRRLTIPRREDTPAIGYIVYDGDLPIAVSFLRKVEGNFGMVDGMCTNPAAPLHAKAEAVDMLIDRIISSAKSLEMSNLLAFTHINSIKNRAFKNKFRELPDQLFVLGLRG